MIDFRGKTALVTGGGAGIGRAIAEGFAQAGAQIVVAEIDEARAAETREALNALGIETLVSVTDVRDRHAVETMMAEAIARFGGLDILVNNVGDFLRIVKPFERYTDDEIEALYATNLKSIFIVTRARIAVLRDGGSIISISSIEAFRGIPMTSVYSAFKHAIRSWIGT